MTAAITIGASDAAAAAGLNKYKSQVTLWQELTGRLIPGGDDNRFTKWGRELEPVIRQVYAKERGVHVVAARVPRSPGASVHRDGWKRASPDGLVFPAGGPRRRVGVRLVDKLDARLVERAEGGLEVKTGDRWTADQWGAPGTDDIPTVYMCQVTWSMHVTRLPRWDVAALIGGNDDAIYPVMHDPEFEGVLVQEVEKFYRDHVLADREPLPDGSEGFKSYLVRRWPELVDADKPGALATDELVRELKECRDQLAIFEERKELLEQRLRLEIGEYSGLESAYGRLHCKMKRGQTRVDYKTAVDELVRRRRIPKKVVAAVLAALTKQDPPSRPLLMPRAWAKSRG